MSPCGSSPTLGPSPTHRTPGAVARCASPRAVPATGSHPVGGLSRLLARPHLAMGGALDRIPWMQAFPAHAIFFPLIGLDGGDPFFIDGSNGSHDRASSQSETRDHEDHREGEGQHLHQGAYHRFRLQSQGSLVAAIMCSTVTLWAFPATSALASPPSYGVAGPDHRRSGGSGPGARGGSRAAAAATARVSRGGGPDTADRSPPATPAPRGGAAGHRRCAPDR